MSRWAEVLLLPSWECAKGGAQCAPFSARHPRRGGGRCTWPEIADPVTLPLLVIRAKAGIQRLCFLLPGTELPPAAGNFSLRAQRKVIKRKCLGKSKARHCFIA